MTVSECDVMYALKVLMEKFREGQKELHCVLGVRGIR